MFPGNRIIEDDIIRETGTSRTSIRPALLRLKYEGLVEMIPNRGAFVAKPSEEDLRQVYRVREVLEHGMLEDAIRHRTEAQLRAMEENLKAQEVLTQHYSRQEYVTLNHTFHWLVVEASANKYYEKYLNELYNKINTYVIFYDQSSDNNSIVSHTMIYEALRDRDLEKGLLGLRERVSGSRGGICGKSMFLCKKRRDTCGVPAGYAVSGGLDRLPLDRLPMGQLDIKDGQQHDAAAHPLPDGQHLVEDDDAAHGAEHRLHAHEQGRHRGGGEPLGVDLDGVGNAYPQHAGKQQRRHGRRQVGQRQALGEEGHQSRQGTGAEELHHHEGQGVHVG